MNFEEFLNRMHRFSNDPSKVDIGGSVPKQFVRINDDVADGCEHKNTTIASTGKNVADSMFFKELYESLLSGNSSYKTYINSFFIDEDGKPRSSSDIYVPKFVNVLVKDVNWKKWLYAEVIGSRLANMMNVPVVFNTAPCGANEIIYSATSSKYRLMSVDFIPFGYEVENLDDMGFSSCGCTSQIQNYIDTIVREMPAIAKKYNLNVTQERMDRLIKDMCLQFLFRSCMCGDSDGDVNNYAIFYNRENGDFMLSPVFDMEGLFTQKLSANSEFKYQSFQSLKYINKHYPELLMDFMGRAIRLRTSEELKKCMLETLILSETYKTGDFYEFVKSNIDTMTQQCSRLKMPKSKVNEME